MKQKIVSHYDLVSVNNMLDELICLERWSELTVSAGRFSELGKQALNCAITYMMAVEAESLGEKVDFTLFPKLAIVRAFTKSYQCDIPERNLDTIFQLGKVSKSSFDDMIWTELGKIMSENFLNHLRVDPNSLESKIYNASRCIGTYLELEEIKNLIPKSDYILKSAQVQENFKEFWDVPGFANVVFENYLAVFQSYSQLRNRIRWAKHPNLVPSSVLGHLFDVGVFAYLMSLENKPADEELATRFFFMGIFHDFPERWTGDMPSPIKDSIPGLRKATEQFENMVMEDNVYSKLPDYQKIALKHVMLEDSENAKLKRPLKKSDTFSAFVECWREIDAGSRHRYFIDVVERDYQKKEELPHNFRLLAEKMYGDVFTRH